MRKISKRMKAKDRIKLKKNRTENMRKYLKKTYT